MASKKHRQEEDEFMASLLNGLDDDAFSYEATPRKSVKKIKRERDLTPVVGPSCVQGTPKKSLKKSASKIPFSPSRNGNQKLGNKTTPLTSSKRLPFSPVRLPKQSQNIQQEDYSNLLSDLAGFSDDWAPSDDEKVVCSSTKRKLLLENPSPTTAPRGWESRRWGRFKVEEVIEDDEGDSNGWDMSKKLRVSRINLHAQSSVCDGSIIKSNNQIREEWLDVILRDESTTLPINPGDIVNIISPLLPKPTSLLSTDKSPTAPSSQSSVTQQCTSGKIYVDPQLSISAPTQPIEISLRHPLNHLILHPDTLLSSTTISGSLSCTRKAILQSLMRSSGSSNQFLIYGNVLHASLQDLLQEPEPDFSSNHIKKVVERNLKDDQVRGDVWSAGLNEEVVRSEVVAKAQKSLGALAERFLGATGNPSDDATLHNSLDRLRIRGIHDVEEDISSPIWGIKGKIDLSVQVSIEPGKSKSGMPSSKSSFEGKEWTMPMEIKTGRSISVMQHRAQTMLYTLLMENRYSTPVPAGLLYYTQQDLITEVKANKNEVSSLIKGRNRVAGYMARKRKPSATNAGEREIVSIEGDLDAGVQEEERSFLPEMIEDTKECERCYALDTCMLYRKTVEKVEDNDSPLADIYADKTAHITPAQAEWFRRWEEAVTLEEEGTTRFRAEVWRMGAEEREGKGRAFANMILKKDAINTTDLADSKKKAYRHQLVFTRKSLINTSGASSTNIALRHSLLNGSMNLGDAVLISIEPDLLALARGWILQLTTGEIVLGMDQKLKLSALVSRLGRKEEDVIFRLDKDEVAGGMGKIRENLAQLLRPEPSHQRLRELVVDLEEPLFDDDLAPQPCEIPAEVNPDQYNAMFKTLTAKDYALILGMPGTGKTSTVVEIIKALVKRGKTVLLTSYTHSAVDNIVVKLHQRASDVRILRLGNSDKVHPDAQQFTLSALSPASNQEQLESRFMHPQVVATTALSIDHPLFSRRRFDYCIVDEASQITLPTCLGPLRFADAFVLVGDHNQLPPLVRNKEARHGGLDISLFRLLSEKHPQAVVDLSFQYRMNEDIMSLSNTLVYGGRLQCGSETVAAQEFQLPSIDEAVAVLHHGSEKKEVDEEKPEPSCSGGRDCWLAQLLNPKCKVVFVDTDAMPCTDSRVGDLVQNEGEGRLVLQIIKSLLLAGASQSQIGVLALYRQQIKLLQNLLYNESGVEVLTADKSQGRDKDCIIISMVRSNESGSIGDLLKDWRRINVSFTRARSKLIIIGSQSTLKNDNLFKTFFGMMGMNNWILKLPPKSDQLHPDYFRLPKEVTVPLVLTDKRDFAAAQIDAEALLSSPLKPSKLSGKTSGIKEETFLRGKPMLCDIVNGM